MDFIGIAIAFTFIILFLILMIPEFKLERIKTQEQIEFYRFGAEYFNRELKRMDSVDSIFRYAEVEE